MNTLQVVFGDRLYVYVCYVYKLLLGMCYFVLYLFGKKQKNKVKKNIDNNKKCFLSTKSAY